MIVIFALFFFFFFFIIGIWVACNSVIALIRNAAKEQCLLFNKYHITLANRNEKD
jgi:hypothetical protein